MLKKTTLAVIGLTVSTLSAAGTMGPVGCTPGNVTVPCDSSAWNLGIQALYLQALYGPNKSEQSELARTPTNVVNINNEWNWGVHAELSYHFNTGTDVTVDWTNYSGTNSVTGLTGRSVPLFTRQTFTGAYDVANKNRYDQVNAVLGQHVDFGLVKKMRFYGGMQYANIQTFLTKHFQPTRATGGTGVDQQVNADFQGNGPVIGIDYAYHLTNEFSVTANGSGSILYGNSRYNGRYVSLPSQLVYVSAYTSKKAVIPALEAKLGLNYALALSQGVMNVEAGYQVTNYFNVFQTQQYQNFAGALTKSDYGLYGPYMGFKYVGNA